MKQHTSKTLYYLSWVINITLPILVFGVFKDVFYRTYFNSDTLYLASLYKDLFVDGTGFKGWNLNGAPNFFPDMSMYFVIRWFAGDFRLAYVIFSIVQYNLLVLLLGSLFRGVDPKVNRNYITLFNLIFPVFLLATILHGSFQYTFDVFSQSYHNGCFINTLLSLNFILSYWRNKKRSNLVLTLVFVFLGMFNDRLFLVTFVAPVLTILIANLIWSRKKHVTSSIISIVITTIASFLLFHFTKRNPIYECIALGEKFMNFSNAGPSFEVFKSQHLDFLKRMDIRGVVSLLTVLSLFVLTVWLLRSIWTKKWFSSQNTSMQSYFVIFALVSVLLTLATPIINGYYLGPACIRYTTFSFFLSLFNVVFIVYIFSGMKQNWQKVLNLFLIVVYLGIITHTLIKNPVGSNLKNVVNYYPEKVKKVDEFTKKHNIQYGVAGYWDAKYTTMFSQNNVRVYTAGNAKLNLWYHVMNRNWYYKSEKGKYKDPEFRFVISSPEQFKTTRTIYGAPLDSALVDNGKWIYMIPEFAYAPETKQPFSVQ